MIEELATCPHCGGGARLRVDNVRIGGVREKAAWVYCTRCFAKTNYFRRSLHPEDYVTVAVTAWNMRTEEWDDAKEEN